MSDMESDAITLLETTLAASATFAARLLAAGYSSDPKGRIFYPWYEGETPPAPFLVIEDAEYGWDLIAGGFDNLLWPRVALDVLFWDVDRQSGNLKASNLDFKAFSGGVIQDLAAIAGGDGQLSIVSMHRLQSPKFTRAADQATDVAPYWSTRWRLVIQSATPGE